MIQKHNMVHNKIIWTVNHKRTVLRDDVTHVVEGMFIGYVHRVCS